MGQSSIKGVRITGMTTVVPSGIRRIEDEGSKFGIDSIKISRMKKDIGINTRYIAENNECASDLCEYAAKILLTKLGYDPASVDCVFMITQTPDYFQPATSCILHGKLELSKNCAAFDVNLGCSGYIYGLWLASMMISSGGYKRILMLAGDTMSRCVSPCDNAIAPLFGDAGSATMIEKTSIDHEITFFLHTDGKGFKYLIVPAGGFRKRDSDETDRIVQNGDGYARSEENLHMNGPEIFTFSIREVPLLIDEILNAVSWDKDKVDYFILHQANKFIIQNIVKRLKIEVQKVPYNTFEKYGNQSCASIPATICDNLSSSLSNKTLRVILAGFGAGLSWAACALSLGPMQCLPVDVLL